jgi:hypothetical protein
VRGTWFASRQYLREGRKNDRRVVADGHTAFQTWKPRREGGVWRG